MACSFCVTRVHASENSSIPSVTFSLRSWHTNSYPWGAYGASALQKSRREGPNPVDDMVKMLK